MRKRCLDTVYELAKKEQSVVFIGSDLGAGTLQEFKAQIPERFFMEGISEQHIVGMAAGMAMSGKVVYVNTIASFLTRRSFEQNMVDIGLSGLKVRLIGNGGGVVYAPLGPTHLAIEDIAIMRAIPGMTILAPCDANEMEALVRQSFAYPGPIYFRLAKGNDPIVTQDMNTITLGKAVTYKKGREVLLLSTGIMITRVLEIAKQLENDGISTTVMHFHTIAPLDTTSIITECANKKAVFTFEEHIKSGGFGSAVADLLMETDKLDKSFIFRKFSLPDEFTQGYGSQNEVMQNVGLDVESMYEKIKNLI